MSLPPPPPPLRSPPKPLPQIPPPKNLSPKEQEIWSKLQPSEREQVMRNSNRSLSQKPEASPKNLSRPDQRKYIYGNPPTPKPSTKLSSFLVLLIFLAISLLSVAFYIGHWYFVPLSGRNVQYLSMALCGISAIVLIASFVRYLSLNAKYDKLEGRDYLVIFLALVTLGASIPQAFTSNYFYVRLAKK